MLANECRSSVRNINNARISALQVTANESFLIVQARGHVVEKLQFLIGEAIDFSGKVIHLNFALGTQFRHNHRPIAKPFLVIGKLILAEVLVKLSETVQGPEFKVTVFLVVDHASAKGKGDPDHRFGQIADHDLVC